MVLVLLLCAVLWCGPAFEWPASCVCLCLWHRARISALSHQQSFLDQCSRSQMIQQFRKILNRQVCYTDSLPAPISALGRRIHTVDTVDVKHSDTFQVLWMKCTFIEGSEKDGLFSSIPFFPPCFPQMKRVLFFSSFRWLQKVRGVMNTFFWCDSPFMSGQNPQTKLQIYRLNCVWMKICPWSFTVVRKCVQWSYAKKRISNLFSTKATGLIFFMFRPILGLHV